MWEVRRNLESTVFGFYNYVMGRNYKRKVHQYTTHLSEHYKQSFNIDLIQSLESSKNMVQYDTLVTSVANGYENVEDYYDKSSCVH